MATPRASSVSLRAVLAADIPALYEMQLDPVANQLAGTKPRDRDAFFDVWRGILGDPSATPPIGPNAEVTPRSILADFAENGLPHHHANSAHLQRPPTLVGCINVFLRPPHNGLSYIGYWIDREHWNKSIATRAVALLLAEYTPRPLYAQVAARNAASLRILERNGFTIRSRCHEPETDRYLAGEVITLCLER